MKNRQLQAIHSLFIYIIIYLFLIGVSWIYNGSQLIHFFIEDNLRIMKISLLLLAIRRLLFISDYALAEILRAFVASLYLFSLSNIITQCFRYTYTEFSFEYLTEIKVIFCLLPTIVYFISKLYRYFINEKSIINN